MCQLQSPIEWPLRSAFLLRHQQASLAQEHVHTAVEVAKASDKGGYGREVLSDGYGGGQELIVGASADVGIA
jgi:hypothetical protein